MEKIQASQHFISLVMMLASAAWQQLGKVPNPISGKLDKEIQNAKLTIELIVMIRDKTKGNLSQDEEKLINSTISDLQLNFADEVNKMDDKLKIN